MSDPLLQDLYGHQAWADAEHWRALEEHPPALDDQRIRERLHHIHIVQRAFRWAVGNRAEQFELTKVSDFPTMAALKEYARGYHVEVGSWLEGLTEPQLADVVGIPWFKEPLLELPVRDALLQAAMHSHYHRAQNATRMRELGAVPPPTDLIVWWWKGRPQASWT